MFKFISLTLLFSLNLSFNQVALALDATTLTSEIWKGHARELLGPGYKKSFVAGFKKSKGFEKRILKIVTTRLPKAHKSKAQAITNVIIEEAANNSLDPYFIMAMITGESSFNPEAVGSVGEIGLMQIRPTTAKWIAKKKKLKWAGKSTLLDPIVNIKLGTAYIAWLREKFSKHGQLYLAAYNMGPRSVNNAVERNVWPKVYPKHVMKNYFALYKE